MTVYCWQCNKKLGSGFTDADRPRFCSTRCEQEAIKGKKP